MTWAVAEAKAKLSEVLDHAETSGLQVLTRRKREFVVMTREELDKRCAGKGTDKPKPFVSAWDALGPPDMELFDVEFPRSKSKGRAVKF